MAKKPSPPPPDPSIISTVAADRFIAAAEEMESAVPAFGKYVSARDRLRAFLDGLAMPAQPSPDEARAAVFTLGLQRVDLDPDDERLAELLAPTVILTPALIQEWTGLSAPGARRAAQVMRDEGRLIFDGRGRYRVPAAGVFWPEADRDNGWVITKAGKLYAF